MGKKAGGSKKDGRGRKQKHEAASCGDKDITTSCRSMTGFGAASGRLGQYNLSFEIKGVNGRFLDVVVRLPRELSQLEAGIRKLVGEECHRGRVEVLLNLELNPEESSAEISALPGKFDGYMAAAETLLAPRGLWSEAVQSDFAVQLLIRKDVLSEVGAELPSELSDYEGVLRTALGVFQDSRAREGVVLARDLVSRRETILVHLEEISTKHASRRKEYLAEREAKFAELLDDKSLPPERLVAEVALLVDRSDVTEEIVRLRSHLTRFVDVLQEDPCGRKIDFLLQECVREANTIASKVQEATMQHLVVEVKSELERMKEQVQNLE
ncbi:MAG: YicC family protein [Bdellovibrionales bacterium]|nr:YicC family protein [Bdellovibrionales bacterium]